MARSSAQKCFQRIKEFLPALKIVTLAIPLSLFDFGTDIFWTRAYLTSSVDIMKALGVLLLGALLIHNAVASFYGLSTIIRQPEEYSRLWKTKFRRCCTCLLHVLGFGSLVFHLDYLVDWIFSNESTTYWRRRWKKKKDKHFVFALKPLPVWKMRHLESMQIIQAFVEALPQFVLQTAAIFIMWTNGTEKQCFPSMVVFVFIFVFCAKKTVMVESRGI